MTATTSPTSARADAAGFEVAALHSAEAQQRLAWLVALAAAQPVPVVRTASPRRRLLGLGLVIAALHLVGWGILVALATSHRLGGASGTAVGLGVGLTVYALGLRHAFDADHIAAIDNTTRKLVQDGQRPVSVGFWFSLGHSSVVFVVCLLLAFGVRLVATQLGDGTQLRSIFGTVGLAVSAGFLILLALINLGSFAATARLVGPARAGQAPTADQLAPKGVLTRLVGRRLHAITKPWQVYPVGLLFGLGFDTATEVGLLALTGGAAALALPWYAIIALPLIFAAGMSLLDTGDGLLMNQVYRWAFDQPMRKLYYNLVVTGVSIVFALGIGTVEIAALLSGWLHLTTGPLATLGAVDLKWVGFVLVGLFVGVAIVVVLRSRRRPKG